MKLELRRRMYIGAGFLSLVIGIIGIPLPLLPTTPFLLLAAFCFSRGSERFHHWLVNHRFFGPPILEWQRSQSIAPQAKIMATIMMVLGWIFMLIYPGTPELAKTGYPLLSLPALVFIWTRKAR